MRITFQLRFHTEYGQSLWICGSHPLLGNDEASRAIPLEFLDQQFWTATIDLPVTTGDARISYRYILRQSDGSMAEDKGNDRALNLSEPGVAELLVFDSWNDAGAPENVFYTEPFQQVLLKGNFTEVPVPPSARVTHEFRVKAPLLGFGETLCLLGSVKTLGNWDTKSPLLLNRLPGEEWLHVKLDLTHEAFPLFYKYGVYDIARKAFVRYEEGNNRALTASGAENTLVIVNDGFAVLPTKPWKGAGVAIPMFSLRSEKSFGIGEFTDLKLLVDWCRRTGLKVIQILPVNDTTATNSWRDSYPYSGISAFALHPLYANVSRVANARNQKLVEAAEAERQRLNAAASVDYEGVLSAKLPLLRKLYSAQKQKTFADPAYRRFFDLNRHWLVPYAAFCHLRDHFGTSDFTRWPAFRCFNAGEIAGLAVENSSAAEAMGFYYFVQFHLHLQLKEAAEYAHTNGVILKGDIPIGVYRHSVDAWQEPEQYHMEMQAGAPPDPFSDKGQNWSFPTYNWPRMKADGYRWWKQRFEQMGHYFDAFRIDHVLGFFRIWSIPLSAVEGILGYFIPALPVTVAEFAARRIHFDYGRYLKPYITDAILQERFGATEGDVIRSFLVAIGDGKYALKPEFCTQRQVEAHFAGLEGNEANRALKIGLYDLISNVLLLETADPQQFHFRFAIESTSSFSDLDGETQVRLKDLYVDYFYRRQEEFWRKEGLQKLPALKRATNMLVCGEDLGMVPACVPEVMKQLGLLSLEVQRMPKRLNQQFSRPQDAPYLSVVTPSTHDMSTIRGWWKEDFPVTQRFYNQELGEPGVAPTECAPEINRAVIIQHLASPAMWSIFQLQDLLGMDMQMRRANPDEERINVPADPTHYWRYRMHLTLESLLAADEFNLQLHNLVSEHGR